jgi:site-specific recombinase XerD
MGELESWVDEWELTLRTGSISAQTRTVYLRGARQFLAHLAAEHPAVATPAELTRRHVESWARAMTEAGRAPGTREIRLKTVRMFCAWLLAEPESGLAANPAVGIAMPAVPLKPVPIIPDDDLAALLATCSGREYVTLRDAAILRMLLDCGVRRSEVVGLDVADVDVKHQEALVHGKGGKDRIVPFGTNTALALTRHGRARAKQRGAESPALFLPLRPRKAGPDRWRMVGGGILEMLNRRCDRAGLARINPHKFRHTWAHDLMEHGANEQDVERLAGWSSPLMVRRYGASARDARARAAARRLSRGDRV